MITINQKNIWVIIYVILGIVLFSLPFDNFVLNSTHELTGIGVSRLTYGLIAIIGALVFTVVVFIKCMDEDIEFEYELKLPFYDYFHKRKENRIFKDKLEIEYSRVKIQLVENIDNDLILEELVEKLEIIEKQMIKL